MVVIPLMLYHSLFVGGRVSSEGEIIHSIHHHSLYNPLGSDVILKPERWTGWGGLWKQRLVVGTKGSQVSCGKLILTLWTRLLFDSSKCKILQKQCPHCELDIFPILNVLFIRSMILTNMIFKYYITICDIWKIWITQWSDIFQISSAWYYYIHSKCKIDECWILILQSMERSPKWLQISHCT